LGNATSIVRGSDQLTKTYDSAGRLRRTQAWVNTDVNDPNQRDWEALDEFVYDHSPSTGYGDPFHFPSLQVGRANGRLVLAVRHNRPITQKQSGAGRVNYGIVNTVDLYDYSGPAGQLEFRQRWAHNVTGDPNNSLVVDGSEGPKGAVAGVTPSDRATKARRGFNRFFESQGQSSAR
jgi:hypothetical protein